MLGGAMGDKHGTTTCGGARQRHPNRATDASRLTTDGAWTTGRAPPRRPAAGASTHRRVPRFPERTTSRGAPGITHVLDRGMSPLKLESLLPDGGRPHRPDQARLGDRLRHPRRRPTRSRSAARPASASRSGGTLLEIAVAQGKSGRSISNGYATLGIDHVEVSNGSLPMSPAEQARAHPAAGGRLHRHRRGRQQGRAGRRDEGVVRRRCSAT